MSYVVLEEAKKCLQCKNPACREGCPIRTDIPEMIRLLLNGGINEAGKMLFENNPLSLLCSLVCNHGRQCQGHCVLGRKARPVCVSVIESYVSERYLDMYAPVPPKSKQAKVAVIGSGPAGMTIAIKLAQYGHDVTIFESKSKIGGVLRFGIPEFRLPKSLLDKYESLLLRMGIRIKPNVTVGKPYGIEEMFRDGFQAISFSTGVAWPNNLGIAGETLAHVHYGVHYLLNPDVYRLGDSAAVIGGGNVAVDAARTAIRHGVRKVRVIVRSDRLNANPEEVEMAVVDGVEFVYNRAPVRITDDGLYLRDAARSDAAPEFVPTDSVLVCIGQKASKFILTQTDGLETNERGLAVVDENGTTGRAGLYASGDVVKGAKTVVQAVEASKRVAEAMHLYLQGLTERAAEQGASST